MLQRTILSADALSITNAEHAALVAVLGMLERGELAQSPSERALILMPSVPRRRGRYFNMKYVHSVQSCGSLACICGWARVAAGDVRVFHTKCNDELSALFGFDKMGLVDDPLWDATPEQGARALGNYLSTGEARWDEVMAAAS